ncbi:1-deoxy-D-xylulose 5-phosphate reductoisomerase [Roseateles asaccharophilus]|uniref:1-deoxy-D-xylulose 5-phosphate reductoisomerase n=2 Tax=Roseateles asaccharophilus TaxID=582607 RepID=A0A4R6N8S0_9BURK|nr:1-deoxy-D-xylulose-5-phosphate reductoisomerase [Roseateles asaccharophilus]TDP11745.1 1-deoxy-D-xylulose 5-phosphate reductoisomerase [Roseateles asaccharophilus]
MSSRDLQKVCVLGSTGSIGTSTLDVLARHPDRYEVFALSAMSRVEELAAQCLQYRPRYAVLPEASLAARLRELLRAQGCATEVLAGERALSEIAAHPEVDAVMAAIVGAAGLAPCLAAARAGKKLMLANKEAIVVGGALFMQAVEQGGATLLPVDSEHSAIFQCLPEDRGTWHDRIDHIVLTASGGPFRQRDPASLADVTPEQAVAHPNWVMGRKISVDSATMMNKALEVIEARWLFNLTPEQIKVVIHPQSIIHSMVVCRDRSVLAQLGTPDMRVPIAYALSFPERIASGAEPLDFLAKPNLTFEEADERRFPGLYLSWQALRAGEGATAVLNAANEEAVAAFLARGLRFDQICRVNRQTLEELHPEAGECASVEGLLNLDARARRHAQALIAALSA